MVFPEPFGRGWVDLDYEELAALTRWFEDRRRLNEPVVELRRHKVFGTLRFKAARECCGVIGVRDDDADQPPVLVVEDGHEPATGAFRSL